MRNSTSTGYKYPTTLTSAAVPNAWTHYSGTIGGTDITGNLGLSHLFPYGAAKCQVVFLLNYAYPGTNYATTPNNVRYANISLTST